MGGEWIPGVFMEEMPGWGLVPHWAVPLHPGGEMWGHRPDTAAGRLLGLGEQAGAVRVPLKCRSRILQPEVTLLPGESENQHPPPPNQQLPAASPPLRSIEIILIK